jgi:hypothetical protein
VKSACAARNGAPGGYSGEPHRRQIIGQLAAGPRGLTITQRKCYCSRCPLRHSNLTVRSHHLKTFLLFRVLSVGADYCCEF